MRSHFVMLLTNIHLISSYFLLLSHTSLRHTHTLSLTLNGFMPANFSHSLDRFSVISYISGKRTEAMKQSEC